MVSRKVINKCKKLLTEYNVKFHFVKGIEGALGICNCKKNTVWIDRNQTDDAFITTVFHELQHILNYRNKVYYEFHKYENKKLVKKYALRAEVYTDKQAKMLARKHGFKRYKVTYEMNDFWREMIKEYY